MLIKLLDTILAHMHILKFSFSLPRSEFYPMEPYKSGRGIVSFLSISRFGHLDSNERFSQGEARYREGAELDVVAITKLFEHLDVDFIPKSNLEKEGIVNELDTLREKIAKRDHFYRFLMVIISSHGDGTSIEASDGQYLDIKSEIISKFHNYVFPAMRGMPKFFLINACRGSISNHYVPRTDFKTVRSTPAVTTTKESSTGDVFILWSTTDQTSSIRFPDKGSPMLQTFSNIITSMADDKTLESTEFSLLVKRLQLEMKAKFRLQIEFQDMLGRPFYLPLKGT